MEIKQVNPGTLMYSRINEYETERHLPDLPSGCDHTDFLCMLCLRCYKEHRGWSHKRTYYLTQQYPAKAVQIEGGAFKSTLIPNLNMETYLLPLKQQLWKLRNLALTRILSSTTQLKVKPN